MSVGQAEETDEERDRADTIFPSSDLREAFRRLAVTTSPEIEQMVVHYKKGVLLDLLEKKEINQNVLRKCETIYLGSNIDIEYPLCLGARKIVLADPAFKNPISQTLLFKKIKDLVGREPTHTSENEYTFFFDFGDGPEEVMLELAGKSYAFREELTEYKIPDGVGLILSFITPSGTTLKHPLDARAVRDKLVAGGMVIVFGEPLDKKILEQERERFLASASSDKSNPVNAWPPGVFLEKELNWIYKKYGYESLPVKPFVVGGMAEVTTFLKKGTTL